MKESVGIRLIDLVVVLAGNDVIFVMTPRSNAGDKRFPNSGLPSRMERMTFLIPAVEVAHDEHLPGARRPDGKMSSGDSGFAVHVSAELFIKPRMAAFVEEIKILIGEKWHKSRSGIRA